MAADKSPWKFATTDGVAVRIDGKVQILSYTLGASKRITSYFGGLAEAIRAITNFSLDAYVQVVSAGLGADVDEDSVFKAGQDDLCRPLVEYLTWLSNGGR